MVCSGFTVYVLVNNTQFVLKYDKPCIVHQYIHCKTATNHTLFISTYTAKQLQTMYYSLNMVCVFHTIKQAVK